MDEAFGITAFLAVSSGLKYLVHFNGRNDIIPKNARKVGTLKNIRFFPVKSFGIIRPQEAECTFEGLAVGGVKDRQYLLVLADSYKFITARAKPKLVKIQPSIHGNTVHLDADGMDTLVLPTHIPLEGAKVADTAIGVEKIPGIDVGDEAAAWMERYLEKPAGTYRLLVHTPQLKARVLREQRSIWKTNCKPQDVTLYQDNFPYHLLSTTSLAELSRLIKLKTGKPSGLTMDQFRPNFEVDGCRCFYEDEWQEIFIGEAKFTQQNLKRCDRCVMTTVDFEKGEKREDGEPLTTLKQFRPFVDGSPVFGVNLVLERPGTVEVGQPVYATF